MRYLLDASSIYKLAELNRLDVLANSSTLDLARYELGNAVLKDYIIHKKLDKVKADKLVQFLYELLDTMNKHEVTSGAEVLEIAINFNLSFYDAAYVSEAKKQGAIFVSEDEKMKKKIRDFITVIGAAETEL